MAKNEPYYGSLDFLAQTGSQATVGYLQTMPNTRLDNRFGTATSAYLRRHAAAPVHWQPWDEVALMRAKRERKPLLLSIGYSACHWCRVMAEECFNDPAVAEVLNRDFVCILVDREERPDIDRVYQEAFRLLYGRGGGWPLNMVLSPHDRVPFFGVTVMSREPREGLPGFAELMQRLARLFAEQEAQVRQQNARLVPALRAGPPRHGRTGYSLNSGPLEAAIRQLDASFDADHGGFGDPPKFPQAPVLERLLRHWQHTARQGTPDRRAEHMVRYTLERMSEAPIRDPHDGGFFHYATDAGWQTPHPERLLQDQAQLLTLYSQAAGLWDVPLFRRVASQLADGMLPAMRAPGGGYRSTPSPDGALLAGGNALIVKALATAGRLLGRPDLVRAAGETADFLRERLWREDRLRVGVREDDAQPPGFLDDHALLLDALLELLQCRWRRADFDWALALADALLERFQDPRKQGGFYFSSEDHEPLIARLKPILDDALPAANGVAAHALLRLGHLLGELRYLLAAERALKNAWPNVERTPAACCGLLLALEEYYYPSPTVVIRGPIDAIESWHRACVSGYAPRRSTLAIPDDATGLHEVLAGCEPGEGVVAYVIERGRRSAPIRDLETLRELLER